MLELKNLEKHMIPVPSGRLGPIDIQDSQVG
jgi:hypothetical protein